jgi:hypothetical protein
VPYTRSASDRLTGSLALRFSSHIVFVSHHRMRLACIALLLSTSLHACADEDQGPSEQIYREPVPLVRGDAQLDRLCDRPGSDPVLDLFCAGDPPEIGSIVDLREALGLASNFNGLVEGFALTGHSTSLSARSVSAINPRVIFMRLESQLVDDPRELAMLAYARGEQFAEIVVRDRLDGELRFYLVKYEQACNDADDGCTPADLLTESADSGWRDVNVYAEHDLENTPLDCRVCHQPDGPEGPKFLRMQERAAPWTHWFWRLREGGRALIEDYASARQGETLAGLSASQVRTSNPGLLASAVFQSGAADLQINEFPSPVIEEEVRQSAAERGGSQPEDNSVPGESETWQRLYEVARRGDAITVPYHDVKVTDPDKLAAMAEAYQQYLAGELPAEELPDLRDVFPDDEELRARMGLVTEPGLGGEQVLRQACGKCHNDRLDQSLSRARFNVDLEAMTDEARSRALTRIALPRDDPQAMPPPLARQLSDEGKRRLMKLLER